MYNICPVLPTQMQGSNPEDRMPTWARKQPSQVSRAESANNAAARRRGATSSTSAGGRPAVTRGDSVNRRPGSSGNAHSSIGGLGGGASSAGGAGVKGPGLKKMEYMGPDGDLVANLERDVLDRSPGIRCVRRPPVTLYLGFSSMFTSPPSLIE